MEIPHGVLIYGNGDIYGPSGRRLMPSMSRGYERVTLYYPNGKRRTVAVHVLVCTEFHGPRPSPLHEVRHLNGVKTDNSATNLIWGTKEENEADKLLHGTSNAKVTEDQVREIRDRHANGEGRVSLAQAYGITASSVGRIVTRKSWSHI
jgi:hypothetical protein